MVFLPPLKVLHSIERPSRSAYCMQTTLALNVSPPSDEATSERFSADLIGDVAGALGVPVSRLGIGSVRAVPKAALQSRVRAGLLDEAFESSSSAARSEELLADVLGPLSHEELAEVQSRFEHEHSRPLAIAVAEAAAESGCAALDDDGRRAGGRWCQFPRQC